MNETREIKGPEGDSIVVVDGPVDVDELLKGLGLTVTFTNLPVKLGTDEEFN